MTPTPPERYADRHPSSGSSAVDFIVGGIQSACELVGGVVELLAGVFSLFG